MFDVRPAPRAPQPIKIALVSLPTGALISECTRATSASFVVLDVVKIVKIVVSIEERLLHKQELLTRNDANTLFWNRMAQSLR